MKYAILCYHDEAVTCAWSKEHDDAVIEKLAVVHGRVAADETVVFSWIEWPDKETRDAAMEKMTDWMKNPEQADPRMNPEKNPMPFDGKRMIFGGFAPIVEV